jgi:hypothetical protein
MADLVFNRSKGRTVQFAELILGAASPYANAAFILGLWNIAQSDGTQVDLDDFAAIEASGSNAELTSGTNANYARKVIDETGEGLTVTYDDTNDRVDIDISDVTFVALGAGTAVTDIIIGFDNDTTGGTDSNILPVSQHDFAVTPDGSDVTAVIATGGFYRAQ